MKQHPGLAVRKLPKRAVLQLVSACRARAGLDLLEGGGRRRKAGFGVDCVLSVQASDREKG